MDNIPRPRAILNHDATQPIAMVYWPYTLTPQVPYCYYKLVTNIITTVTKIKMVWYMVTYIMAFSQSAFRALTTQFIICNLRLILQYLVREYCG